MTVELTECNKWSEHHELFATLMEMKELLETLGYVVCEPNHGDWTARWVPANDLDIERKFMEHHGIDRNKLEQERRALLDKLRLAQQG